MINGLPFHVAGFIGSLAAIPIVGEITPDTAQGILATGNAQAVLALVAIAESIVIWKLFQKYQSYVDAQIALNQAVKDALTENSSALKDVAKTIDKCKGVAKE